MQDGTINALANFAIISRSENREIKDKAPSKCKVEMPEKELKDMRSRSSARFSLVCVIELSNWRTWPKA
ncbi:hypothetical protein [Kribbella sp. NPDC049584]|uniref:hypothetical protein n=1 Tax=Kribbella sp. NPDC049584 TaxID=3154833 RepID=UPI00342D9726